ncbi:unnamed protein product [Rhizoctonia solani]|uniref:Metacaspase-1 n=1 Tax=Rhizoctonia solani TaxID=456999 RepID=A0A8H3CKI1_9AGAM|nr:unnamed protein product [Rhizoctonia solani]CAE6502116.1 unnamed protein product [Rhizoctonia solani]
MGRPQTQNVVAGRATESLQILPKLTIPSQQQSTDTSPPTSIYYDAYDYFYAGSPESPIPANGWHTAIERASDDRLLWNLDRLQGASTTRPAVPPVLIPTNNRGASRGLVQGQTLNGPQPKSPVAARAQAEAASTPLTGTKKAVAIGLNYTKCGKKDIHLTRSHEDARRVADTLKKQDYLSENIKVVIDGEGQLLPSCKYLIECMDWLVKDASKGDQLFFAFSGHCEPPKMGQPEPHLVAADLMAIPRSTFHEHLVAKVPAGAELTIVLDCCNAAGMVQLQYCVGKMDYEREVTKTIGPATSTEPGKPAPALPGVPQHRSLHGLPAIGQKTFPLGMVPTMAKPIAPGAFPNIQQRKGGIATAQPLRPVAMPNQAPPSGMIPSFMGGAPGTVGSSFPAKPPGTTKVKVGRNLVVEGAPLRHFEARERGFVAPAGKVTLWAGAGIRQKSYEPTGDAKNSIVTDAICAALDKCAGARSNVTWRDVWKSLVGAVDKENNLRSARDKLKDTTKLATNTRWQCAEVWTSQEEPLSSSSPVLDRPVFWTDVQTKSKL